MDDLFAVFLIGLLICTGLAFRFGYQHGRETAWHEAHEAAKRRTTFLTSRS